MPKTMYMVRAGQDSVFISDFLDKKMIAIGWSAVGNLENVHGREAIGSLLREHYPEYNKYQLATNTGQVYRFRDEIVKDSLVITYDAGKRIYHVGRIIGDYLFQPSAHEELRHTKAVEWLGEVPRDGLSAATKNSLGAIATVFSLSEAQTDEIEAYNGKQIQESTSEEANSPVSHDEDSEVRRDTEQRALEFLQDRLAKLSWEEMQDLVAGLLRAMGYKTRISPPGPDRGRDIIASPDGFGFQAPRIIVEVIHRKDSMGAPEIRAFAGGLRHDSAGLYVSTGGFSKEARYEADRANHHVALMDAIDLGKAVIEHYDNMDAETRTLLPLKRIYWPA